MQHWLVPRPWAGLAYFRHLPPEGSPCLPRHAAVLQALVSRRSYVFRHLTRGGVLLCRLPSGAVPGARDTVVVSSPGLAILAALRWLAEGRSSLRGAAALKARSSGGGNGGGNGSDALDISQLLGPVNGSFSTALTLVLSGQGQPTGNAVTATETRNAVLAALSALLRGMSAPVDVTVEKEVHSGTLPSKTTLPPYTPYPQVDVCARLICLYNTRKT